MEGEEIITGVVVPSERAANKTTAKRKSEIPPPRRYNPARKIKPWQELEVCQLLAEGKIRRIEIASMYGVSPAGITQFAKKFALEIYKLQKNPEDAFASLWIADKPARVAEYQRDVEQITEGEQNNDGRRTKAFLLRNVAEELGQLPPRQQVVVAPVTHIVVGVDIDDLS
jgi:hypothetical protein